MRASRLLAIMIVLQLRGRMTGEMLAREFEVSQRTIYRDIDALSAAGVPVWGDKGPGGGFELLEGYRTRLTGLAEDETEAMLLAGLPEQAAALGLGGAAARARDKLFAALPTGRGHGAQRIAGCFHLDTLDWYRSARPAPHLAAIARAVLDRRSLAMTYASWSDTRDWRVEPYGLVHKAGSWYLIAKGLGKVRTFSVADVVAVTAGEGGVKPPPDFDLAAWWASAQRDFELRLRPGTARLCVSPAGLERLRLVGAFAADAVAQADTPDARGWRGVSLPLETIEATALLLLGIGPEIEVLEPPALREVIARLAAEIVRRMNCTIGEAARSD